MCKQINLSLFLKNVTIYSLTNLTRTNTHNLALNNPQGLLCHKTTKPIKQDFTYTVCCLFLYQTQVLGWERNTPSLNDCIWFLILGAGLEVRICRLSGQLFQWEKIFKLILHSAELIPFYWGTQASLICLFSNGLKSVFFLSHKLVGQQ